MGNISSYIAFPLFHVGNISSNIVFVLGCSDLLFSILFKRF